MKENQTFNAEFPQRPENTFIPEHTALPEYNPVYPDINFFKESSVTCKEENIFQGLPPAGEDPAEARREKRKERNRYALLQKLLGYAVRGGAAVLFVSVAVVAFAAFGPDKEANKAAEGARRSAFTQQTGYTYSELARLWEGDPNAPHKYDLRHQIVSKQPTCTEEGEAEIVCTECGVHTFAAIPPAGHKEAAPVRENQVDASCAAEGSYTQTIKCTVCGEELSRTLVTIAKKPHSPGKPITTGEAPATCTEDGSYEEIVLCSLCGEEISLTSFITPALGHSGGDPVKENEQAATCTAGGQYENVVYCSRCQEEISRTVVAVAPLGHSFAAVRENETAATCTASGQYDEVMRCSVCGEEQSRRTVPVAALGHSYAQTKQIESGNQCVGIQYYYLSLCSRCGQLEPNTGPSTPEWEEGIGHSFPTRPTNGQASCSRCGEKLIEAWYNDAYVHYTLDSNHIMNTMSENGYEFSYVALYSYSAGMYVNEGGYEYGDYSSIMIPDEYRVPGSTFRVDFVYNGNNNLRFSSNDVVYTE